MAEVPVRSPLVPLVNRNAQNGTHAKANTQDARKTTRKGPAVMPRKKKSSREKESVNVKSIVAPIDLRELVPIKETTVLEAIKYHCMIRKYPYLHAGQALLAVNPYTQRANIYDNERIVEYHSVEMLRNLPPHIYAIAEQALRAATVQGCPKSQTIIVSGESGAGKTYSTSTMIDYLAQVCTQGSGATAQIAATVKGSSTILEAFGNARTTINKNSSRFAKFVKVYFESNTTHMRKCEVETYLLERTRISDKPPGESNFHIFEQLVLGLSQSELASLHLERRTSLYGYLANTQPSEHDSWFVQQKFNQTVSALKSAGIHDVDVKNILKIVAATLHLGNIKKGTQGPNQSQESMRASADLLSVSEESLRALLFERVLKVRGEEMHCAMSQRETVSARDTLAKSIFVGIFDFVVHKLNREQIVLATSMNYVGFFDIFGFETLSTNSLEQLCINYANEKLQQLFVERSLKAEQELYQSEGLPWSSIAIHDNSNCVHLIESRYAIFGLLNEECTLSRRRKSSLHQEQCLAAKFASALKQHEHFDKPLAAGTMSFAIKHCAGQVIYDATEFVAKNLEQKEANHIALLHSSTDDFVQNLIHENGKKKKTVVSKFKTSLSKLYEVLRGTESHYIRCIKPNKGGVAGELDDIVVQQQLKASCVIESIKISASGLPYRMKNEEFRLKFSNFLKPGPLATTVESMLSPTLASTVVFGKTQMFLNEEHLVGFENALSELNSKTAILVQSVWRMILARRVYLKQRRSIMQIQQWWRACLTEKASKTPSRPVTPRKAQSIVKQRNPNSFFLATPQRRPIGINWRGAPIIPEEVLEAVTVIEQPKSQLRTMRPTASGHILSYCSPTEYVTFRGRQNAIPNANCVPIAFRDPFGLRQLIKCIKY